MEYRENGTRYKNYCDWGNTNQSYNYVKNGLIQHIMSHNIAYTKNKILSSLLIYFEESLIFLLKYVDRLKNFKNYHWKNR